MGPLKNPEPEKNQEKKGAQPGSGPPESIWFFFSKFRQATKDMPPDDIYKLVEEVERYAEAQDMKALRKYPFVFVGDPDKVGDPYKRHAEGRDSTVLGKYPLSSLPVAEPVSVDRQMTEYAEVLAHAVDTFGSRINANAWLNRPNRVFHN